MEPFAKQEKIVRAVIVVCCLLGTAFAPHAANAAQGSRAACQDEVRARIGESKLTPAEFSSAVQRCLRYGPDAIAGEGEY
jgi:hypothetical protein